MKNSLFNELRRFGVFKANHPTGNCSLKTLRRKHQRGGKIRMVWNSVERGTYVRAIHGELKTH